MKKSEIKANHAYFLEEFGKIMLDNGAEYRTWDRITRDLVTHVYTFHNTVGGTLELTVDGELSKYGIFVYARFTDKWTPKQAKDANALTGCSLPSGKWNKVCDFDKGAINTLLSVYGRFIPQLVEAQPIPEINV